MKFGQLYIVATPIGNLEDISARALATLQQVDAILVEDKRHSGKFLQHYQISKPLYVYHDHTKPEAVENYLSLLRQGKDLALISDAGTPLISDPGYRLVRQAQLAGIVVTTVPGPSAIIAALSIAGLPTDRFAFEGFLPPKGQVRIDRLKALEFENRTLVFYEAPHRLVKTLQDLAEHLGPEREVALIKELTKLHERVQLSTLGDAASDEAIQQQFKKGEAVLVVRAPNTRSKQMSINPEAELLLKELLEILPPPKACAVVAKVTGLRRQALYDRAMQWLDK